MFKTDGLKPRGNRRAVYVSDPSSVASRYLQAGSRGRSETLD